jgi:uncharacterized protein (DUF2267 family)
VSGWGAWVEPLAVKYEEFVQRVGHRAGLAAEDADRVARALAQTLSERLGPKESRDTASQLPKPLQEAFAPGDFAQVFDAEEFVRRVAERGGISADARAATRAVFITLQEALQPGQFEDWETELTTDYVDLGARRADVGQNPRTAVASGDGPFIGPGQFVDRVSSRAGLDSERAKRAIEAVLETFGERIADGEAHDLAAQLPEPVAEPLRRASGDAQAIPADEFVRRIAAREQAPEAIAREHVRAVLTTVREAVTADEWDDTMAELPREYDQLMV